MCICSAQRAKQHFPTSPREKNGVSKSSLRFVEQTYSQMVMEVHWHEPQLSGPAELCFYVSTVVFKGMAIQSHCV